MNIFHIMYYVLLFPVYAAIVIVVNTIYTLASFVVNSFSNFFKTCKSFVDTFVETFTVDKPYNDVFKSMNDFMTFPLTLLSNFAWILLYIIEVNVADIVEYPNVASIIDETMNETSDDVSFTGFMQIIFERLSEKKG